MYTSQRYTRSSKQAVFHSNDPITDEQIARYAPAILASGAHESRSERYKFIDTKAVLDGLRREGFEPFEIRQTRCRLEDRREFTKHMLRLRHRSTDTALSEFPEIVLLNAHDGTSGYKLLAGVFRMICSNGLIAGDMYCEKSVRHSGDVVNKVIDASFEVLDDSRMVMDRVSELKELPLERREQEAFAEAAAHLKWDEDQDQHVPVKPTQLLLPQRFEDRSNDLWTTFNRVQEHLLEGGVHGRTSTNRRMTTRPVTSVTENVRLNRALWTLTEKMAELKAA